nr:WXG100 family type VII secretion target [Bacillus subtilis]
MDSYKVIELANKYSAAAEEVRSSKMLLESRLSAMGDAWQGKARDSFDQDFEETKAAYDQFEQESLETSQELKVAAVKIEERKAEIARMEELERKAREERHKLGR